MINEAHYPVLRLNADFRPTNYPITRATMPWQNAVRDVFKDRIIVVEEYEREIRCPGSHRRAPFRMNMPAVVALKYYEDQNKPAAFTRAGVFLRDQNKCAYCSKRFGSAELTFDHVIPQSRGGKTNWTNVVAACSACNSLKANKPLKESGLRLQCDPYIPTRSKLIDMGLKKLTYRPDIPKIWLPYLGLEEPKDTSMTDLARVTTGSQNNVVFPVDMTSDAYWNVELDES